MRRQPLFYFVNVISKSIIDQEKKILEENAAAVDVTLTSTDLEKIESLLVEYPDVGQRYSDGALKLVNQ